MNGIEEKQRVTTGGATGLEIAVIGMAGRFPGAANVAEFWENLKNGVESIGFFSEGELEAVGVDTGLLSSPAYIKAGGMMADAAYFDAAFFGCTPGEAQLMLPHVRIYHHCVWEALEDAAVDPDLYNGRIGIYSGSSPSTYWEILAFLKKSEAEVDGLTRFILTNKDSISTHIAYKFNLRGPAVVVQTACSTSLVAVHMAVQGLLNGECEMALAGGVTISLSGKGGYLYQEGMIGSGDGHVRTFDARANGVVGGSGAAVVVLKPLEDAVTHGDHIYAVVKGSAINNDGTRKVGYTAPSVEGQTEVIKAAQYIAEVEPESIGYLETHGTATKLGDPVEIEALKAAFMTGKKGFCGIGSVKSNVGHLDNAAGAAGFIKAVLALYHKLIPPSLHYETPNPHIDFENSPFYVVTRLSEWKSQGPGNPLRAGVSSFGIGGTNAHIILEEWTPLVGQGRGGVSPLGQTRQNHLILLSAKTETALEKMTQNLARHFENNPGLNLADVAYTLQVGRKVFPYRRMLVSRTHDIAEAAAALADPAGAKVQTYAPSPREGNHKNRVVFMFAGLGSQYVNMGRDLYEHEPLFRREMDRCFEILEPLLGYSLKETLYPQFDLSNQSDQSDSSDSQPAVFSFEYALAKLLMEWGVKPSAMIGYSFGEYTAACISGVLSLPDALKVVAARARLLRRTSAGVMSSVPLTREEIMPYITRAGGVSLAIDNGPSCVIAGEPGAVENVEKQMKEKRILCVRVPAARGIHSHLMEPVLGELERDLRTVTLGKPQIPYISNVTGEWITEKEATNPGYWARHLRETVQFAGGMKTLLKKPGGLYVEIGPGRDIGALAQRHLESAGSEARVINLVRAPHQDISDVYFLLNRLGRLWLYGQPIDWQGFYGEENQGRQRLSLPTYPFENRHYWVDDTNDTAGQRPDLLAGLREKFGPTPGFDHWFYTPTWTRQVLLPGDEKEVPRTWLVFRDGSGFGPLLEERLKQRGHEVIVIESGSEFDKRSPARYIIDPGKEEDYHRLFKDLETRAVAPSRVLHMWGVNRTEPGKPGKPGEEFEKVQERGFYSLLNIAKAIGRGKIKEQVRIEVVTDQMQEVTGDEPLCPAKATIIGPLRVIPQEFPGIRCRSIDVHLPGPGGKKAEELADRLEEEISVEIDEPVVAYRGTTRWVQTYQPLDLEKTRENYLNEKLKEGGVYLLTGGTGKIGMMLAEYLAKKRKAKLVLTSRSPEPRGEEWDRQINELERIGGQVRYYSVDVSDKEGMRQVISQVEKEWGPIDGVIHAAGGLKGKAPGYIRELEKSYCEEQYQAKVKGLEVLAELFQGKEPGFYLLYSSIAVVLGGLGFAAYAGANSYMDAFAREQDRTRPGKWISVNWDGMEKEKTQQAFERILSLGKAIQVAASRGGNLQARISRWVKLEFPEEENREIKKTVKSLRPRPALITPYVPPRGYVQQKLTALWQNLFGYDRVGIRDDFFELGGDSLKALVLLPRIHKELEVEIPVTEFFHRPTIEKLAAYIDKAAGKYEPIRAVEKRDYYPQSSAQKRLFFLNKFEEIGTGYNMPGVLQIKGKLDKNRFESTLRALIQRHESLGTSFTINKDEPIQRVHCPAELPIALEYHDGRQMAQGSKGKAQSIKNFIRPFDLAKAPLLRIGLVEMSPGEYLFMFDMHHIISDGVSYAILMQDFNALYRRRALPPILIHYKDYSEWQNSKTYKEAIQTQESFWMGEFSGDIPVLEMPTDYPRPAVVSFEGSVYTFEIDREHTLALNRLALAEKSTLFTVLLAAGNVLLAKICNQEDIIVGTPITGRNHVELERTIGMFVNTLLLKNHVNGEMPFNQFLREVTQRTLGALRNQDYPFEELVEKTAAARNPGRNPMFDVMFALQNIVVEAEDTLYEETGIDDDLKMEPYRREDTDLPLDLIISASETGEKIIVSMKYCTKLYKAATIERISGYFMKVVTAIAGEPGKPVAEIDILPGEEKERLIHHFNAARQEYPRDKTIHELFEEQVLKTPGQIAVQAAVDFRDVYEELNSEENNPGMSARLETCCFHRNRYLFECHFRTFDEGNPFILLKTPQHNIAVVNKNVFKLLDLFDGKKNLVSIYNLLQASEAPLAFLVYAVNIDDVLEISFSFKKKEIFLVDGNFTGFIRLVKFLYRINFIRLENVNFETVDKNEFKLDIPVQRYFEPVKPGIVNPAEAVEDKHLLDNLAGNRKNLPRAEVLLLGDTPGQSSAGLLYLASYLKRNGIDALCLFNDALWERVSLQKNIEELLIKVKPRIVGISMKWFIHIARALGLAKIVKEYSQRNGLDIKVVLGGNSASFFREEVIKDENVDYIVRGDGELPFLKLCRGEAPASIPNLVYKEEGEIIANPITYVQTPGNSADIYLSHLDEIMISHYSCVFGIFFIFTQKGCQKNCYYCGGCNDAQRIAFNRPGLFRRNVAEVRKDIIESKKFTSTIFFLFDEYSNDTLLEYCREIWEGIDLSRHIGFLSNVILPTPELIEYCNKVFRYVYWNLDMASMSERHRLQLLSENMVKAQPTDSELLEIFDECEKYDNNEIIINFITGLPYFNQGDIEASKRMLSHIIDKYSCFGEYFWARLHAEPGAPVIARAGEYNMYSLASDYDEFLEFSRRNFREFEQYPNVDNFIYPYIYFQDEEMNSAVSKYYVETHHQWLQYKKSKRQKTIATHDLTYRQLNERADRLAETLKNKGVRSDTIVGIMTGRSLEMIVGLLAILKAGGAYLPLDPEYPGNRIAYMMEDCRVKLLLSQGHLAARIPFKNKECDIIDLAAPRGEEGMDPAAPVNQGKNSLAYIIFTSGSTGKPKGVAVEHRSIVNTLIWRKNYYRFDENDIVMQLPSFSFDSSVEDIFTPLISGSQLLLVGAQQRFDMDYIRELLKNIDVTHFLNVPALYKTYLEEIPQALAGLKHITIAGENFNEDLVVRHFQRLPQVRLYNEYGPTENSVCSTVYEFSRENTGISIGKPIHNVECYILDGNGGLNPIGTAGELVLAGVGISRGYLNNPELTAEKFLRGVQGAPRRGEPIKMVRRVDKTSYQGKHPFVNRSPMPWAFFKKSPPGRRRQKIYKTGDRVRWLPGGDLEFLGRIDNQVKIRGYRVETGEITDRILKHAGVKGAVVLARENADGEKYLAAYIVSDAKLSTLLPGIREYLSMTLPEYMVPAHFIAIDRLPLTPGGKIDTRGLPDPELGPTGNYAGPGNEIERKMVEIWAEILAGGGEAGKIAIGIDDNFFQLGGHSLKAVVMVSRIHKIFNVKVPMMEIFNWPTVRGLSEYIKRSVGDRFISIEPVEKKSNYALSAAQRRLFFFQQMNKTSTAYNAPNAYILEKETDMEKLRQAFRQLIQRHDSLRSSFHMAQGDPGYAVQRVHDHTEFEIEYDRSLVNGRLSLENCQGRSEVSSPINIEKIIGNFIRPFDLTRAPLLRVGLIEVSGNPQVLVYDMHHIITDGTSMQILIRDFLVLYGGGELPKLRLQYKDYAEWQNSGAGREAVKKQEDFWLRTFAGKKPVLDLPLDHPRPKVQSYEGAGFPFALEPGETRQLKALAVENEATLFMVVLGLFSLLLSRLGGQEDIVVGTGTEGRRHDDLRGIIGMFVNTLALRAYPEKNKTFAGFLKEIKEMTLAAFENQDYPFEDLVEKVVPNRDTNRNPLFDVVFQFQAAGDTQPGAQTLQVKPYQIQAGISKFDLTLWGYETGETLYFNIEYRTRLFEEETIKKMAEYFKRIVAAVLEDPGNRLINLEIFTEEEQREDLARLTDNLEMEEWE